MTRFFFVDECLLGPFLGLGGFLIEGSALPEVERTWGDLKRDEFGIDPQADFKWNMQPAHPAPIAAEQAGYGGAKRADAITRFIGQLPITILVSVHIDHRPAGARRSAFDLYRHALKGVLAGWTREIEGASGRGQDGTHALVLDSPPVPGENRGDARFSYLTRREMVAFDLYQRVYRSGVDFGWTQLSPLRRLGAASAPTTSHASQSLALQMADCVVGCITGFVKANTEWASSNPGVPRATLVEDASLPNSYRSAEQSMVACGDTEMDASHPVLPMGSSRQRSTLPFGEADSRRDLARLDLLEHLDLVAFGAPDL